ncbi:MAG: A/G-specific adenine glycosylase [Candidatus Binatia bacterium]
MMAVVPNGPTGPLRRALLAHYDRSHRDLPWRRTRDPYRIWLSEVMLQQTRVETVEPRYRRFLRRFPTVGRLAAAQPEEVCEEWAGLGYYSRAQNLNAAARRIVERHGGRVPRELRELECLPGIGRYTAGAIASIAFDIEAPVVDGNVTRELSRLFALDSAPRSAVGARQLWSLAGELVRGPRPGDLNQAIMELGATLCLPAQPRCGECPLQRFCRAAGSADPTRYPLKATRPVRPELHIAFAWAVTRGGVWLERRPLDGLWAGLWQPPAAEGARARRTLEIETGLELGPALASIDHQLTHRRVIARVFLVTGAVRLRRRRTLAPHRAPLAAPLSALARKAVRAALAALR